MRPFADLPVRHKTRLVLLGVLALFMVFGAVALERTGALQQAATHVGRTSLPMVRLIGEIDTLASAYRAAEADVLLAVDAPGRREALDRVADLRASLEARLAESRGLPMDEVAAAWSAYARESAHVLALADAGWRDDAGAAFRATGDTHRRLGAAVDGLLARGLDAQAALRDHVAREAERTRWVTLGIGTGLMIVGLAVVLLFEASLVASTGRLLVAMKRVAAGDPHARVPHVDHDDEFGELARAVRAFADGIDGQRRRELELRAQAGTDSLTGVANRRAFLERADEEISRALRYGHPLSLLMIDIDHFKRVNDTHGHAAGDAALIRMVEACNPSLREHDLLARLGGEEFVVLLPHTDSARALLVAERLREAVEGAAVATAGGAFHITISIGAVTLRHGEEGAGAATESLSSLLERADQALYGAKRGGRNRVVNGIAPAA